KLSLSAGAVGQQYIELSVQSRRKRRVLVIEVNEIGRPAVINPVSPLLQAESRPRLAELLSGKNENDVPPFIPERHSVGEGILPRGPPYVRPQRLINPRPRYVERLMAKGIEHPY